MQIISYIFAIEIKSISKTRKKKKYKSQRRCKRMWQFEFSTQSLTGFNNLKKFQYENNQTAVRER